MYVDMWPSNIVSSAEVDKQRILLADLSCYVAVTCVVTLYICTFAHRMTLFTHEIN